MNIILKQLKNLVLKISLIYNIFNNIFIKQKCLIYFLIHARNISNIFFKINI